MQQTVRYQMSENSMQLLMSVEALRGKPYDDQTDAEISNWVKGVTIGYGHLISRDEWSRSGDIVRVICINWG